MASDCPLCPLIAFHDFQFVRGYVDPYVTCIERIGNPAPPLQVETHHAQQLRGRHTDSGGGLGADHAVRRETVALLGARPGPVSATGSARNVFLLEPP